MMLLAVKTMAVASRSGVTTRTIFIDIRNVSNYITFPPQIAYKLIEAGRTEDILQVQGLSIDVLNNSEDITIQ